MGVDTRDKRFSMLGFGLGHGWPYVVPNPDGAVDQADRPQWVHLYHGSGIALSGTSLEAGSENLFFRRRRADRS